MQERIRPRDDLDGLILRVPVSRGPLAHRRIALRGGFSRILHYIILSGLRKKRTKLLHSVGRRLYNIINTMNLIKSHDNNI